jgi:hypothetical protein
MAKKISKKKEEKPEIKPVKRGRPAQKKEKITVELESNDFDLLKKIYGNEKPKQFNPFPQSDLQTQTKNIISQYDINVYLLPQNILDSINSLVTDFSMFVSNPNMFSMISQIMDKDLVAVNLIKEWIDGKESLLLELKEQNASKITETASDNINPSYNFVENKDNHLDNKFTPRNPASTYQHTINNPPAQRENKDIHYQVLSEAYPSIIAQNTAQQNWGSNSQVEQAPIDMDKVFEDYCQSIYQTIMDSFQMRLWGYIPQAEVENIISRADKLYKYEFKSSKNTSYIEIMWKDKKHKTKFFNVQE